MPGKLYRLPTNHILDIQAGFYETAGAVPGLDGVEKPPKNVLIAAEMGISQYTKKPGYMLSIPAVHFVEGAWRDAD